VFKSAGGEEYSGIKNKTGAYQSSQSDISAEADRRIIANEREAAIQKEVSARAPPASPEQTALFEKQQQEIAAIDALKSNAPQLTVAQRNVESGKATMNALVQTLGIDQNKIDAANARRNDNVATNLGYTFIGKVTTLGGRWGSLSNLFSKSNQGNIKNLQGDVSDMITEGTRISRAATSRGADVQTAINSLTKLEEGVRSRYADAITALSASPQDVAEGLDFADDISRDLRIITEQRQALERYQLTGDVNQVLLLVGSGDGEEVLQ
jgi:hypothetical protein